MTEQVWLVRRGDRYDYTTSITPARERVKPGLKKTNHGDWVMSKEEADRRNSLIGMVGATISLHEARVKVGASEVEVVAGPFATRSETSDDPAFPAMTRTVVSTPAGEVGWSNKQSTHVLPDGRTHSSLAGALRLVLGL